MGVNDITETDIEEASWMDDVGKAIRYLQDIAETSPSIVPGNFLDDTKWTDKSVRVKLLKEWLTAEALQKSSAKSIP